MGRTYAGVLGSVAFVTVLARSLVDGGGAVGTLQIATACLFCFAALGFVAGQIADMVVLETVRARIAEEVHPPPPPPAEQDA